MYCECTKDQREINRYYFSRHVYINPQTGEEIGEANYLFNPNPYIDICETCNREIDQFEQEK